MRKYSAFALVVGLVSLLAACGGSDDDAGGSDGSVPSALEAAGTAGPTILPSTPTTGPTTTATTSTSTSTTPPTTAPDEAECLEGSWWLSPEETTSLYAALMPGIPVTVTGSHWVEFSDGAVDNWVVLEMRFAAGGIDLTFGIDQHGVGTYTVVDNMLTMNYDTFDSTVHEGHGTAISNPDQHPETYADEAIDIADNGDGTITINRWTLPAIDVPPVAGGPMGCDADTMSLGFTSGLAETAAVYVRRS